jgi:trehalose-phosphatase
LVASRSLFEHLDEAVAVCAARPFGLFCDLDGTISPIVADPVAARVSESARRSLRAIRRRGTYVAIVSGRTARMARAMVGLRGIAYVGVHGLEWYEQGRLRRAPGLSRGALGCAS